VAPVRTFIPAAGLGAAKGAIMQGGADLFPGTLEKANSPTAAPDLTLAVRAIMDFPMPGRPIEKPKRRIHA